MTEKFAATTDEYTLQQQVAELQVPMIICQIHCSFLRQTRFSYAETTLLQ